MTDSYKTIKEIASDEFIERKSRFIGYISPAATEEEAVSFINSIKARHREATHNVYAYTLRQGQQSRFSDDGEPSGTAGRPVLEVIQREGLVDCAVVVTRYFGGILLGAGGLVRAYAQGAKCAIDASAVVTMKPAVRIRLTVDYNLYGKINYILPDYGIITENTQFEAEVTLTLMLEQRILGKFTEAVTEISSGSCVPAIINEEFYPFT